MIPLLSSVGERGGARAIQTSQLHLMQLAALH
jgi:hypothetical protein